MKAIVALVVLVAAATPAEALAAGFAGSTQLPLRLAGSIELAGQEARFAVTGPGPDFVVRGHAADGIVQLHSYRESGYGDHDGQNRTEVFFDRSRQMAEHRLEGDLRVVARDDGFRFLAVEGAVHFVGDTVVDIGRLQHPIRLDPATDGVSVRLHEPWAPEESIPAGWLGARLTSGQVTIAAPARVFLGEAALVMQGHNTTTLAVGPRTETKEGGLYDPIRKAWFGAGTHTEYVQEYLLIELRQGALTIDLAAAPADYYSRSLQVGLDGNLSLDRFTGRLTLADRITRTVSSEDLQVRGKLAFNGSLPAGRDQGIPGNDAQVRGGGDVTYVSYAHFEEHFDWRPSVRIGAGALLLGALAWALAKAGSLAGLVSLFSRITDDQVAARSPRREIYDCIARSPGIYLKRIAQELGVDRGTLQHHLRILVRAGYVERRRHGRMTCYFDRRRPVAPPTKAQAMLDQNKTTNAISRYIQASPGVGQSQIAKAFKVSASTVAWHAERLRRAGAIHAVRVRGRRLYYPLVDRA